MVHLAGLARLQHDPGAQAGALANEMVVHGGDRQQRGDRRAQRSDRAVGEDQDVDALGDRLLRVLAQAIERPLHARGSLGDRPGDVERARGKLVVGDVAQRLELTVEQDRLAQDQLVGVLGRLVEEVALSAK